MWDNMFAALNALGPPRDANRMQKKRNVHWYVFAWGIIAGYLLWPEQNV